MKPYEGDGHTRKCSVVSQRDEEYVIRVLEVAKKNNSRVASNNVLRISFTEGGDQDSRTEASSKSPSAYTTTRAIGNAHHFSDFPLLQ